MAQKPISPEGGPADLLAAKLPRGTGAAVDELARRQGMNRSEYVRALLLQHIEVEYAKEVAAEAS